MEIFPHIKGVTSSVVTSARLLITAAVVGLESMLYNATIYPIVGVVVGIVIAVLIMIAFYEKGKARNELSSHVPVA